MSVPVVTTNLDRQSEAFETNRQHGMLQLLCELDELLREAAAGGGEAATARHRSRGKLPVPRAHLPPVDPDSPFLELSPVAGYATDYAVGGGAVLGIGVVENTECVIVANDPTVLGGAMTEISIRKILRALEVSRQNRMPYVQFVESAGADLTGGGRRRSGGGAAPRGRPLRRVRGGCSTRSPSSRRCASRPSRWCSAPPPPAAPTSRG